MPVEPRLSDLFSSDSPSPLGKPDAAEVIRRSRRRRLPRQIGVGSVATLAVVGVGALGVSSLRGLGSAGSTASSLTASSPESSSDASGSRAPAVGSPGATKRAPADRINLCGGTVAEVAPSQTGLVLTVDFPDAAAGTSSVAGTVTLTNTGAKAIDGVSYGLPAITLARHGIVTWHSTAGVIRDPLDIQLAAGQSMTFDASFSPVVCGVEDDLRESFRTDLPPAPAGEYQVSAAMDVTIDANAELVTGPASTVTLR